MKYKFFLFECKFVDYILIYFYKVIESIVSEISVLVNLSDVVVIRFCKLFGLKGF